MFLKIKILWFCHSTNPLSNIQDNQKQKTSSLDPRLDTCLCRTTSPIASTLRWGPVTYHYANRKNPQQKPHNNVTVHTTNSSHCSKRLSACPHYLTLLNKVYRPLLMSALPEGCYTGERQKVTLLDDLCVKIWILHGLGVTVRCCLQLKRNGSDVGVAINCYLNA